MEEKKFDLNTIIGFVLIGAIFIWMLYLQQPTQEEIAAQEAEIEAQAKAAADLEAAKASNSDVTLSEATQGMISPSATDSLGKLKLQNRLGSFAYSASLPSASDATTTIENDVLSLTISNKGGYITQARLKQHTTYDSIAVDLIKNGNASLNFQFSAENRLLNTQELYFEPRLSQNGDNQVLTMRLKASETSYLEYRYELVPGEYMTNFSIKSQGLEDILNTSQPMYLDWTLKGYRHAKSISYENRYSRLTYEYETDKYSKLSPTGEDQDVELDVNWLNFRQHFFSSMLLTDTSFKEVAFSSKDLVEDETIDTVYTKQYGAKILIEPKAGAVSQNMNMYYGPTDYKIFKEYGRNLDQAMPLGWGIFGMINKYVIIPLFGFLSGFYLLELPLSC